MANPALQYLCINAKVKLLTTIFVHYYMKKIYTFIAFFICSLGLAIGQTLPYLPQPTYQAGENLTYKLKYGFMSVATGTLKVEKSKLRVSNPNAFHLSAFGQTSGLFAVYKVRNKYDSYIDGNTYLPDLYIEDIHELCQTHEKDVTIDHPNKKISGKKATFIITRSKFLELLPAYFFARNLDHSCGKKGQTYKRTYFVHDDVAQLGIKYIGIE